MEKKQKTARIIVEKMREITQVQSLAELGKILGGISSQSISGAIKKGKIPERWIETIAAQFDVTNDDLLSGVDTDFGIDDDDSSASNVNRGLTLNRHIEIGAELYVMHQQLQTLVAEFLGAYPRSGPLARAVISLQGAADKIREARCFAEENLFHDCRDTAYLDVYYPGSLVSTKTMQSHLAELAALHDDFVEIIKKGEPTSSHPMSKNKRCQSGGG